MDFLVGGNGYGANGSLRCHASLPSFHRPMLPDGLPVAGRTPLDGLYVHGGLGSIGMHSGPATARWLADAVAGGAGEPDLPWLTPARLPGWERPVAERAIA